MRTKADRMRTISILLSGITAIIIVVLFNSMVLGHNKALPDVKTAAYGEYQVHDEGWGLIRDRKGEVIVGASPAYTMEMEISWVTDTLEVARQMAPLLDKPEEEVAFFLASGLVTETNEWIVPWRAFTEDQMQDLVDARLRDKFGDDAPFNEDGLPGPNIWPKIKFHPTWVRTYPEGDMLAPVLGYTNMDGQGQFGIEEAKQDLLRPEQVTSEGNLTQWVYPLPDTLLGLREVSAAGDDIYLTIDRTIQAYIEDELQRALEQYLAKSGTIIVMEVETGNILAMASYPTYMPANYWEYWERGEEDIFANPAVSHQYEPGSVFKAVTMSGAYDSGSIDDTWSYIDTGVIYVDGIPVPNALGASYGTQNAQGVLNHSLNTGVATIATQWMGPAVFYHYVEAFGFGYPTKIELADEAVGTVHLPRDNDGIHYEDLLLANNSFGQSIAVTPLQMINAMNVIANGGELLKPHIILKRQPAEGPPIYYGVRQPLRLDDERTLSPETAERMRNMLQIVVEESVTTARVPGYKIAGKTGTAQVPVNRGDIMVYDPDKVITSFIGFGPMPDPKVIILVKIDEPGNPAVPWGTNTAAPTFSRIAQRVFLLLGLPPDDVDAYNSALVDGS